MSHNNSHSITILHIAAQSDWQQGLDAGEYRAASLDTEGFIHASGDEDQLRQVVVNLFAGRTDLLVLDIDIRQLSPGIQVLREPAPSGEIYPHIYGPINLDAVTQVRTLIPDPNHPDLFALVSRE